MSETDHYLQLVKMRKTVFRKQPRIKADQSQSTAVTPVEALASPIYANETKPASSSLASTLHKSPRILLIDVRDDSANALRSDGFDVSTASFGEPFRVERGNYRHTVVPDTNLLGNFTEQDVIIIDLAMPPQLEVEVESEETPDNVDHITIFGLVPGMAS
jgi:hypothetical protein